MSKPMTKTAREMLHNFALTYRVESKESRNQCLDQALEELEAIIRNEKQKLLAEVRERVVGEDEKLVIPDYPKTDDEGEPLYSKRAAKEGRKQVTARYHTRKELRNDQRTELTKLEAEL